MDSDRFGSDSLTLLLAEGRRAAHNRERRLGATGRERRGLLVAQAAQRELHAAERRLQQHRRLLLRAAAPEPNILENR